MCALSWDCRGLRDGLIAALILAWAMPSFGGSRALERGGNIFVLPHDGVQVQVTSSGSDSEPDLSSDGKKVVFVRKMDEEKSEIWIADLAKRPFTLRPLVRVPLIVQGRHFERVFSPRFSPQGTTVYCLIPYAATTHAIIKVQVGKPAPVFVMAALRFEVLPMGRNRGDLVVQIRKAKLAPGYFEWYWLVTPDGKEVGVVGQDEGDVALFMEQQRQAESKRGSTRSTLRPFVSTRGRTKSTRWYW